MIKEKIREEIKVAINKEKFVNEEDAELINAFLKKFKQILTTKINLNF